MARKAVRLSDIAEKLGVSTVTVSNALANQRGVSEELREKIKEMASEMGYHAPGTQIMAKTAVNIGVLVQERYLGNGSSFYWRLYQELAIACAAHNCLLAFCVLKPDCAAASGPYPAHTPAPCGRRYNKLQRFKGYILSYRTHNRFGMVILCSGL